MLPAVHGMFALIRDLANGREVTEIAIDRWFIERHSLGPLVATAGAPGYRDELAKSTLAWAKTARALPDVVALLVNAGVRVSGLKGVSYATSIYANPALRPMSDIDLLVDDGATTERVLGAAGYIRQPAPLLHHARGWIRGETVLDIHTSFASPKQATVDVGAIFDRMTPNGPGGASRLDLGDELAFHLIHMWRNRLNGPMIQIVDLHRLLERADVEVAIERATSWGLGRATRRAYAYYRAVMAGTLDRHFSTVDDIITARQPSLLRRLAFELSTAESVRQPVWRALDKLTHLLAGRPKGDARGR